MSNDKANAKADNGGDSGPKNEQSTKEEAWGYDLYPERRGTFKPKISNVLLGREGKEGIEKVKCEKNVYDCVKNSEYLQLSVLVSFIKGQDSRV